MKHTNVIWRLTLRSPRRQQGVVLYVALVVMIAMMLAGVAMLRSVGTGVGVAGNLAFKQNATLAADRGATAAIAWLAPQPPPLPALLPNLDIDDLTHRYHSSWDTTFNPLTFDWAAADAQAGATAPVLTDSAGNTVSYVIHRLCKLPNQSAKLESGQECSTRGDVIKTSSVVQDTPRPLFRITTRVQGPRNTLSYVQVLAY